MRTALEAQDLWGRNPLQMALHRSWQLTPHTQTQLPYMNRNDQAGFLANFLPIPRDLAHEKFVA